MTRYFWAIALAGLVSAPAFAMDDMSCADFTAMDSAAQMQAVSGMEEGMMGDTMSTDDAAGSMMSGEGMAAGAMAPEDTAAAVASTCADHPDMMVGEAMGMIHE